jgi:malate synthase
VSIKATGARSDRDEIVLNEFSLALIEKLNIELNPRRKELLKKRQERILDIANGKELDFLAETKSIREDNSWKVHLLAPGLIDRRVEITGPTERKMTINALNSGAKVWLADQEDSTTPNWENVVQGQINLNDAINGTIEYTNDAGKKYQLRKDGPLATIVMRPRGLHLPEKHILIDGEVTSGSFVDFALYMCASAKQQIANGLGPFFYLAKLESHLEARLWNDAFKIAQDYLGIPQGTIRATVLIETYPAAFEMEETLLEH